MRVNDSYFLRVSHALRTAWNPSFHSVSVFCLLTQANANLYCFPDLEGGERFLENSDCML